MTLPPIEPTGAMSSGDYVTYMMGYNELAEDSFIGVSDHYITKSTIDDWYVLWERILNDTGGKVTTLESAMAKLKAQVGMVKDAINKL